MLHPNLKSTFNNYYTIIISLYSIFKSTRARAKLFHTIRRDTIFLVFFFFFFPQRDRKYLYYVLSIDARNIHVTNTRIFERVYRVMRYMPHDLSR